MAEVDVSGYHWWFFDEFHLGRVDTASIATNGCESMGVQFRFIAIDSQKIRLVRYLFNMISNQLLWLAWRSPNGQVMVKDWFNNHRQNQWSHGSELIAIE